MAEDKTADSSTSSEITKNTDSSDASEGHPDFEALYKETQTKLNATSFKLRKANERLKELEISSDTRGDDKDSETIKDIKTAKEHWSTERKRLEQERADWQKMATEALIERDVLGHAAKLVSRPDVVLKLTRDDYEVGRDEYDRPVVVLKNSDIPVKQFIENYVNEHVPELKLNTRKHGTGPSSSTTKPDGNIGNISIKDLEGMTREQRVKAIQDNPELRAELVKQLTPLRR